MVVILMGGNSPEAEVSRKSAKTVSKTLANLNIKHVLIEHDENWLEKIKEIAPHYSEIMVKYLRKAEEERKEQEKITGHQNASAMINDVTIDDTNNPFDGTQDLFVTKVTSC